MAIPNSVFVHSAGQPQKHGTDSEEEEEEVFPWHPDAPAG
jgi:hypothetical protein